MTNEISFPVYVYLTLTGNLYLLVVCECYQICLRRENMTKLSKKKTKKWTASFYSSISLINNFLKATANWWNICANKTKYETWVHDQIKYCEKVNISKIDVLFSWDIASVLRYFINCGQYSSSARITIASWLQCKWKRSSWLKE